MNITDSEIICVFKELCGERDPKFMVCCIISTVCRDLAVYRTEYHTVLNIAQ